MLIYPQGTQFGNFAIEKVLGQGAIYTVFQASEVGTGRKVALKVLNISDDFSIPSRSTHRMIQLEARMIETLDHPNIVKVYTFGFQDIENSVIPYIAMQLITGGTLQHKFGQPLEMGSMCWYIIQLLRALHYAHEHDIVHRDVRPSNVLFDANVSHHVLLSDFKLARTLDQGLTKTNDATLLLNLNYTAPETVLGNDYGPQTDLYGAACILYEGLAGVPPLGSYSTSGIRKAAMIVQTDPEPIDRLNPQVPNSLAIIIQKALQKQPARRFLSAEEFAEALSKYLTTQQRPGTRVSRSRPSSIRQPRQFRVANTTPFDSRNSEVLSGVSNQITHYLANGLLPNNQNMADENTDVTHRIFISHCSEDSNTANSFMQFLNKFPGVQAWSDLELQPLGDLMITIPKELQRCEICLILLSPFAMASRWVLREAQWALTLQDQDPSRIILIVTVGGPIYASDFNGYNGWIPFAQFARIEQNGQPLPMNKALQQVQKILKIQGVVADES